MRSFRSSARSSNSPTAWAAVISSTSTMDRPPTRWVSTSSWNRRPSHSWHVVVTGSMNARSVEITPRPEQPGQAPAELKLNSPASTPFSRAKTLRMVSSAPMYEAGVEREEAVIALWSTTTACGWAAVNTSETSVDLPEPATPVTTVSTPVGNDTSSPLRLCRSAPRTGRRPVGERNSPLSGVRRRRHRPVSVSASRSRSNGPSKTTCPPSAPARGPMSTMWSATAITSGSCSTTSTVLPLSRSRTSRSPSRPTSRG
ncbi:hypothetical protein SMICM17S_04068 [Streptomyces microflavus]